MSHKRADTSGAHPDGVSMFLGAVTAVIALYASYTVAATVDYAQF